MSSTNKIAEYASAGLPIVCTGPGASMPSLVESGLMTMADAGDVDAYANALAAALRRVAEPATRVRGAARLRRGAERARRHSAVH